MLGHIIQALLDETKGLFSGTGEQVLLKTNFLIKSIPDNTGTFVLLDCQDAQDSTQFPGGLTMCAYNFMFNTYCYEPDAFADEDGTNYSTSLLGFIDKVRRHFTLGPFGNGITNTTGVLKVGVIYKVATGSVTYNSVLYTEGQMFICLQGIYSFTTTDGGFVIGTSWKTQGMVDIANDYGFQFTLTGIGVADAIEQTGLLMGYKIGLISTALDKHTLYTENDVILQTITQINNPPFSPPSFLINNANEFLVNSDGEFLVTY